MINDEVVALNNVIRSGGKPSDAYKQFGIARELEFNRVTKGRYLNLAATNFDHFGDGAVAAYRAGHANALKFAELAGKGLPDPGMPYGIRHCEARKCVLYECFRGSLSLGPVLCWATCVPIE